MPHTINVSVDYNWIVTDAIAVIEAFYTSGEPIGDMVSNVDFEKDVQFTLLYEFLVAAHVRALICRTHGHDTKCRVAKAHWLGEHSYADVEFPTKADAMLFKLSQG